MLPGNVDPRRPDKVQRYKPPVANANGQGEDLTPDYMNILGQRTTTANAPSAESSTATAQDKHALEALATSSSEPELLPGEEGASSVIPTSPQYGVAIIPTAHDLSTDTITIATDTVVDTTAKADDNTKDPHSTPSRNDRFKVVKIASLEPFKRGRWKCMDYVDEAPPPATQPQPKVAVPPATSVYLQTQSLPQQQIQQMLMQGGFTNGTQFYQNVPAQMMPQAQYFYPPGANMPAQQMVNPQAVPSSMPAQFMNPSQPYFTTGVVPNSGFMPPGYANVQYVPANLIQGQNSAFVPTSQLPANFQQSQTYAGPPNVTAQPPLVNGHAYTNEQVTSTSIPTQAAKSVILSSSVQQPQIPNQIPVVQNSAQSQSVPVIGNQQPQQQQQQQYQPATNFQPVVNAHPTALPIPQNIVANNATFEQSAAVSVPKVAPSGFEPVQPDQKQANSVYTNPQFDMSVSSLTVLENPESVADGDGGGAATESSENADDPSKTNPVVNAIDNKIEQAMDLVKSHLMYTVREEVEVLKEKIAELMEKIQQLETENNFLRAQIPKSSTGAPSIAVATTVATTNTTTTSTALPNEPTNQ